VKLGSSHCAFKIATLLSFVLLLATLGLSLATRWLNPWDHRVSLSEHFHISVWEGFSGDKLGMLVFYNNAQYGPYRGSIISLSDDKAPPSIRRGWSALDYDFGQITSFKRNGSVELIEKACDLPGVYFRHIWWPDQPMPLWTLMISPAYPLVLFGILPAIWAFRHWKKLSGGGAKLASG